MELYKIDWRKYLSKERSRKRDGDKEKKDPDKHFDQRNEFDSDFGRAVFSSACRRMHDKTQVMPLSSDDNVHSRLTHSLEVMSIAQSLGDNICRDPKFKENYDTLSFGLEREISAILRTAAIMHDIGNPPFGHFGEHVISKYFEKLFIEEKLLSSDNEGKLIIMKNQNSKFDLNEHQILDFIQYDGNAQGLRVMTKLQYLNDLKGLNLTYGTLGAYLKYPNEKRAKYVKYIGAKKHGIYYSEMQIFEEIYGACNLKVNKEGEEPYFKRHPLSFLVEAADTICYRSMDIEDGWNQCWYSFDEIIEKINVELEILNVKKSICDIIHYDIERKKSNPDRKKMVDFRVALIQYFVNLASRNFILNLESIDNGHYLFELLENDDNKVEAALKEFNNKFIFTNREIQFAELTGSSVIKGLLDILIDYYFSDDNKIRNHGKNTTSKTILRTAIHETLGEERLEDLYMVDVKDIPTYQKLRIIVDFVSGMTDQYAVKLYQRLSGQKL